MTMQQPQTKMTLNEARELLVVVDSRIYDLVTPAMVRGLAQRIIDLETRHRSDVDTLAETSKAFDNIAELCVEAGKHLADARAELLSLRGDVAKLRPELVVVPAPGAICDGSGKCPGCRACK